MAEYANHLVYSEYFVEIILVTNTWKHNLPTQNMFSYRMIQIEFEHSIQSWIRYDKIGFQFKL